MDISDITATDLEDDIIDPKFNEVYGEKVTKRLKDDGFMPILANYISSVFQDFESFLKTEVDWVDDDNELI